MWHITTLHSADQDGRWRQNFPKLSPNICFIYDIHSSWYTFDPLLVQKFRIFLLFFLAFLFTYYVINLEGGGRSGPWWSWWHREGWGVQNWTTVDYLLCAWSFIYIIHSLNLVLSLSFSSWFMICNISEGTFKGFGVVSKNNISYSKHSVNIHPS